MPVTDNAATFLGINNENEFYSAHYLAEVFKGDISDVLNSWKQKEESDDNYQAPYTRLKAIARDYFSMRERTGKERNHSKTIAMQRQFFKQLCHSLDIPWEPHNRRVETEKKKQDFELPLLSIVPNGEGAKLWVLGALDSEKDGTDPLLLELKKEQFIGEGPHADGLKNTTWYNLINDVVFKQDEPPRWLMLLSDRQCILIDRYKWLQNRLLRFDLDEILGRKDNLTLQATAALLHVESLAPEQGCSLLDTLDERSYRHAFEVSEDLKYALREAIEILGNEAAEQLVQRKDISFTGKSALDEDALTRECLRYMYRLLFLFYIEARPELKYVPHQSEAYRKGYSLESLRDLELVKLTSEESRKGYYFHHSISLLFKLIHEGYKGERDAQLGDAWQERGVHNSFTLEKLDSHLFDPKRTPYLNKVKFSNQTLQTVIRLMSLTRETSGRGRRRRGRVSYAQLGINQLGAVYEALLSYRGFFASEDLYEVQKPGENYNELETGYFVPPQEIDNYTEEEKVYVKDENGSRTLKMHPKGKFIYRLAGRDRQKSASYYTPEVLTKCLVKYTLKECLKGLKADDILKLTVCEPAMGSAAFLNEAVNQLAEAYLTLKQQELNKRIPHDEYREALQQVKMHIADHNVFGVDLNPIAVELAEVSLWLNALSKSSAVPWFGYQLFNGNSLIGARRQVYRPDQVVTKKKEDKWYKHEPKRLDPLSLKDGSGRDAEHIYHFLLPDEGMVGVNDTEAKKLKPDAFEKIKQWKKQFLQPLTLDEVKLLQQISGAIDKLWKEHTDMLRADRSRTEDRFPIWGQFEDEYHTSSQQKDQIRSTGIFNNNAKIASPYRRLKLVMDYWCALWFWPLDKVDLLPDRSSWLFELNLLLQGQVFSFQVEQSGFDFETKEANEILPKAGQKGLFSEDNKQPLLTENERKAQQVKTAKGELHLEKLLEQFPRLNLANELAIKNRFFHWELTFADVFADRGGFDIMLGNPPWQSVSHSFKLSLSEFMPEVALGKLEYSSSLIDNEGGKGIAFAENVISDLVEYSGIKNILSSMVYPRTHLLSTDLYKSFIEISHYVRNGKGTCGLVHQNSVYEEDGGGKFRSWYLNNLTSIFSFVNQEKIFPIGNTRRFSLNVSALSKEHIECIAIFGLYHPATIDECFVKHDSDLAKKDKKNSWNREGSKRRLVFINSRYFDATKNIGEGEFKLVDIRSGDEINIIKRIFENKFKIQASSMENSIGDISSNGFIKRTDFVESPFSFSLESGHIKNSTLFGQTPDRIFSNHRSFSPIRISEDSFHSLPRTNVYVEKCHSIYDPSKPRVYIRRMVDLEGERTLQAALGPLMNTRDGVICFWFDNPKETLALTAMLMSLPYDYMIKVLGKANVRENVLSVLPFCDSQGKALNEMLVRAMALSCVNEIYEDIWKLCWEKAFCSASWSSSCNLLSKHIWGGLHSGFQSKKPLLNPFERRQALIEIDVIVSMILGMELEDLLIIYRSQFPVLKQNDCQTYFDSNGNIVFTTSISFSKFGVNRKSSSEDVFSLEYPDGHIEKKPLGWEDICPDPAPRERGRRINYASGQSYGKPKIPDGTKIHRTVIDDTLPGGPIEKVITYVAPFYLPDREEDYRIAWEIFAERFKEDKS